MIATMTPGSTWQPRIDHRTEPRILLQMTRESDNAKLQPTVFLPGLLQRLVAGDRRDQSDAR